MKILRTAFVICLALVGCDCPESNTPDPDKAFEEWANSVSLSQQFGWNPEKLTERDIEIITIVLQRHHCGTCFLTLTPSSQWYEEGGLKDIPEALRVALSKNSIQFRPASEAYIEKGTGRVKEKASNAEGTLRWARIRRWISDTEVEVEDGQYKAPLGGGGTIAVYEKVKEGWRQTKHLNWMS